MMNGSTDNPIEQTNCSLHTWWHEEKLTDCPDNLRESIDWLIQVRYGNGEGGKGLTKLSQALKKLIEEAISNAFYSLCPDEKGTSTPPSTPSPSSGVSPSSPSSTGWTTKISDKIQELNKQKDELEKRKNANNGYLTEKDSKSLDSLPTQVASLETVQKLAEFADQLDTNKRNHNNILNNLCVGLETFLGFNSTSNGYDGSGIVYSDLDRLCDGVMGFLSGVLEAVKNENEVTTYDNNLQTNLQTVLKEVNKQIGSGRAGLAESVDAVKEWLEGYGEEVGKKTNAVTNSITTLSNNLIGGYTEIVKSKNVDNLKSQLEGWRDTVETISNEVSRINDERISELDDALKSRINNEMNVIVGAAKALKASSMDGTLQGQAIYVDEALKQQESDIRKKIQDGCEWLRKTMRAELFSMRKSVTVLEVRSINHIRDINDCLKKARESLDSALGNSGSTRNEIHNMFTKIKDSLKDVDPAKSRSKQSELRDQVQMIKLAVENVDDTMHKHVHEIYKWMKDTNKIIDDVKRTDLQSLFDEVDNPNKCERKKAIDDAAEQIEKKTGTFNEQFMAVKGRLDEEIAKVKGADGLTGPLKQLSELHNKINVPNDASEFQKDAWQLDSRALKNTLKSNVTNYIMGYVEKVRRKVGSIKGLSNDVGLQGMKKNVWQYAQKFSNKNDFTNTVLNDWIADILKHNAEVMRLLKKYVEDEKQSGTARNKLKSSNLEHLISGEDSALHKPIKDTITKHLQAYAYGGHELTFPGRTTQNIVGDLQAVRSICEAFAKSLNANIENGVGSVANDIVRAIDTPGTWGISSSDTFPNFYLNRAVEQTLVALSSAASEAANELGAILQKCNIGNVDVALQTTEDLLVDLHKALQRGAAAHVGASLHSVGKDAEIDDKLDDAIATEVERSEVQSQLGELLQNAVKKGIAVLNDRIQNEVVSKLNSVDGAVGNSILDASAARQAILGGAELVRTKLAELCRTIREAGKTVQLQFDHLKNDKIENELAEIKSSIASLRSTNVTRVTTNIQVVLTKIEELDKVPGAVDKCRDDAERLMHQLYNDLFDKLNTIGVTAAKADDSINEAIQAVLVTLETSLRTLDSDIETLKTQLIEQVTSSFAILTGGVRKLFTAERHADLRGLEMLVETQHLEIQKIIDNDKATGLKGMLKTLSGVPANFKGSVSDKNNLLSQLEKAVPKKDPPTKGDFTALVQHVRAYLTPLVVYNKDEIKRLLASPSPSADYSPQLKSIFDKLVELLNHLEKDKLYNYDHNFVNSLTSLNSLSGLSAFTEQLGHAYVNRYSGQKYTALTVTKTVKEPSKTGESGSKVTTKTVTDLTPEGRNCAKVCLTIVEMVSEDLKYLREQCDSKWSTSRICSSRSLGAFMQKCGYRVAIKDAEQNGELQNKGTMTGLEIHRKLVGDSHTYVYNKGKDTKNALENFHSYLNLYYDVCHIAASLSTRRPCSISEILIWLTSLRHNPVYFNLITDSFSDLFDKREKKKAAVADDDFIEVEDFTELSLAAYPQNLTPSDLHDAVMHVTSLAPVILTTIVGFGDEYTTYAVDYHSNAAGFAIPSSPSSCLSMLLELMRRLFPVFRFLHSRCSNLASEYGWYHCAYGSDVESAGWQCKDHSKTDVDCRPRSPLMSYLRDSLPGHLPHQLTSVDCKSECKTCPKSTPGMPCITPLGFKGFSGSKRTGKDISNVLTKFFDKGVASCLLSLSPRPPSSLPEHYAFALSFVKGWSHNGGNGLQDAINKSIKSVSMELRESPNEVTDALRNAYGDARGTHNTGRHPEPKNAAVSSLSISTRCRGANHCGPYLSTLYSDTYPYFGNKHCNAYMSWSVYLPWTFWQQLNSLYDAFLQIFCQDWGCTGCLRGDTCKKGAHGMLNPDVPGDGCKCQSIVGCKGVGPTLYQYGFTFQDVHCLISNETKCFNLRNQLCSVLNSQYFKDLFEKCDEFLWIIRQPFSYLVLTLWLLSVLYLIHIMVIRLDLLHIKSHLHSPSSHRIAAQSLLAAARVNKLNRVFYLQP
ncbi:hypothetical protein BBBOND_0312140 [Babesia bigemina]|uniref:C3H1-type domain-containing protein n=1 Tax=Babesia bigemina TaxID=5866 RepID=A0A061D9H2_BABBI|nr:hypothetical protein BBBOND_0312140 [Babesia bigemina]CDR97311.1 hypothetical protein BBBOND_0312140 [Babesia bigemina]|eukprot:XP_012769497.1 hypothetical protein BBBOND_0312140 [Babesia bigemina]